MGLFGKKNSATNVDQRTSGAEEIAIPDAKDLGVILHVMPKDFLGVEATLKVEPTPVPSPQPVVAPLSVPPLPNPTPIPAVPLPRRRVPLAAWVIIFVLLLFVGGALAYVVLIKSQDQVTKTESTTPATLPSTTSTTPATPTTTTTTTKPSTPERSKDSDSDGLTDIEERMYGTDYRNPDTDGDTFLDGNEVFHRYDPNGLAPSTLLDTGAVKEFSDATAPFTMTYPTSWKATVDAATNTVTFKTPNVVAIEVTWSTKEADLTLEDWILKNVEGASIDSLQPSYTKEGYYTLRSENDLVAYIEVGTTVYVMTYDLKTSTDIAYIQTFAMMANSLTVTP